LKDHIAPLFVGRKNELQLLEEYCWRERDLIFLAGSVGSGKTSLLHQFTATAKVFRKPLLISDGFTNEVSLLEVEEKLRKLNQKMEAPQIVAFDNVSRVFTGPEIDQISETVRNFKRLSTVIFVTRYLPEIARVPIISLSPLDQAFVVEMINKLLGEHELKIDMMRLLEIAKGNPLLINLLIRTLREKDGNSIERFLSGDLYNLGIDLVVPQKNLVEFAKPKLILTGETLAQCLKDKPQDVYNLSPREYEILLAELLDGMGYEVELTPETRDGGKDIMAYMNTPHGRILCLVEAKKYRADRPVGVGLVRELYGTFIDSNATNAMLVTTSKFSKDAREFQARHEYQLALRDYDNVVQWIERHKVKKQKSYNT